MGVGVMGGDQNTGELTGQARDVVMRIVPICFTAHIMQAQANPHCPFPRSAEAAPHAREAGLPASAVIPSERLLLGQTCVTIDHDGTRYVLRATRAGKLILTK